MGTSLPLPKKGVEPSNFRPCLFWPNNWMDQDGTWLEVGLSPGDFVLDGDPAPSPKGGGAPLANFRPISIVAKRLDASRCHLAGMQAQPRGLCVRWGPSSPSQKGGGAPSPIFGPVLLWPNGWMHQDATWYGGRPLPRGLCVRWGHSSPSQKGAEPGGGAPNFRPMSIVAKRLDGSRWHLA